MILLLLPSAIQEYFLDSVNMMFSTVIPNKNSLDFVKNYKKFYDLLRDYFNEKQSSDFEILINPILLVVFGDMENNNIDLINFYSCDRKFIKNFNTIYKNKDTIFEDISDKHILDMIKFISVKDKISKNQE